MNIKILKPWKERKLKCTLRSKSEKVLHCMNQKAKTTERVKWSGDVGCHGRKARSLKWSPALKGILEPQPLLLFLFPKCHEVNRPPLPCVPDTTVHCAITGPKQDKWPWITISETLKFLLSWFFWVFSVATDNWLTHQVLARIHFLVDLWLRAPYFLRTSYHPVSWLLLLVPRDHSQVLAMWSPQYGSLLLQVSLRHRVIFKSSPR